MAGNRAETCSRLKFDYKDSVVNDPWHIIPLFVQNHNGMYERKIVKNVLVVWCW
jgi:hypothetical protein